MGGDLLARAGRRVSLEPARAGLGEGDQGPHGPPPGVELGHVQGGQAGQLGQVGAVEQALHVGLAEADRPAQQGPVEAGRVDVDGDRRRARLAVAEAHEAPTLDERQRSVAGAAKQRADEAAGALVGHRRASASFRSSAGPGTGPGPGPGSGSGSDAGAAAVAPAASRERRARSRWPGPATGAPLGLG